MDVCIARVSGVVRGRELPLIVDALLVECPVDVDRRRYMHYVPLDQLEQGAMDIRRQEREREMMMMMMRGVKRKRGKRRS